VSGSSSDTFATYTTKAECENAGGKWSSVSNKCAAKDMKGTK
jgi:hypothetical protein